MKVGATQVSRLYAPAAGGKIGGAAASSQYGAQTAHTYLLVLQVVTAGALGGAGMASAIAETMVSRNCEHRVQCCSKLRLLVLSAIYQAMDYLENYQLPWAC